MSTAPIEGWAEQASLSTLKTTYYRREVFGEEPVNGYDEVIEDMSLSSLERKFFELSAKGQVPFSLAGIIQGFSGVHIKTFGAVGDGNTDDYEAIKAAFASGVTVRFDPTKVYAYNPTSPLIITPGTRLVMGGAKLFELSTVDQFRIVIQSSTMVDRLDVSFAGGDATRGVQLAGNDISVGSLNLIARSRAGAGNFRRRALSIGKEGELSSKITIGDVHIDGWDYAAAIWESNDVTINNISIVNYRQGVLVRDSKRWAIRSGNTAGLSPNAVGMAGENAVLIESTKSDNSVEDGLISNFVSEITGEHGFRLGGQYTARRITWENCVSRLAGSGIGSGIEPENHGGCGFKALGPTSNISSGARHEALRYINCTVENLNKSKQKDNFAGFHIGKCYDVQITNPIVRAIPDSGYGAGTYAAYNGIELIGSENVAVTSPIIRNCSNAGISFIDATDSGAVNWGDHTNVQVIGGIVRQCRVGIEILNPLQTIRRIKIDGTEIEGGEYALYQTPGTSALTVRCSARITAWGPQSIATVEGLDAWNLEIIGDELGSNACRNGSTFTVYGTGARKLRKGGLWATL